MSSNIVTIQNVTGYLDENGTAWLKAEDVTRGLGWTQLKNNVEYVRWEKINGYLAEFNFPKKVGKDDFIPENMFYRLVWKSRDEKALSFQAKVADEILPAIRKTGSYSVQKQLPTFQGNEVELVGKMAEDIQNVFAVKRGIALSQAIDIVGGGRNINLNNLKKLLPSAEHETGFLNATQIGEKLGGLKAKTVNRMLKDLALQYKDDKCWRITSFGMEYGEEMPFTRNGHSGYQIRWNEKLIDLLKGRCKKE